MKNIKQKYINEQAIKNATRSGIFYWILILIIQSKSNWNLPFNGNRFVALHTW
jgi:hypothetical protein